MWNQTSIFGEKLEFPTKEELKDACCESCYTAKEPECDCKCHGAFHGLGNLNGPKKPKRRTEIDSTYEKVLPESEADVFRKQYQENRTRCLCGCDLSKEPIVYYAPHSDGWTIKGESEKVWLYVKCPNCGYDMSIWKLGVLRE